MITQRVGQLSEGDEFTADDGESWMTVMDVCVLHPEGQAPVVLVTSISGKRWWGHLDEEVIVKL
jgi:hypothetical protein